MTAYRRSAQYGHGLPAGVSQPGHATARCPDQTIVPVLVRLALFLCDTDNRRGRKHIGTGQQSAGQTTAFLQQHTIV